MSDLEKKEEARAEEELRRRTEKDARELGRLLDESSSSVSRHTHTVWDDDLPFETTGGLGLDKITEHIGLTRYEGETDVDFRGRVIEEIRHKTTVPDDEHADKDFVERLRET